MVGNKKIVSIRRIDNHLEKIYEEDITYICPVRGKVTQRVKIKKLEYLGPRDITPEMTTNTFDVDKLDNGGDIYSAEEEDKPLEDL